MKTRLSPLRTLSIALALALAGALSSTASADVLTEFRGSGIPSAINTPIPAYDWMDGITNVTSIVGHGTVTKKSSDGVFGGWASTMDLNNYAGFSIIAEDGFSLTIDSIQHKSGSSTASGPRMGSIAFGYRIDADGAGAGTFGDWVLTTPLVFGDAGFNSGTAQTWDLDISTTGIVEFGFFGTLSATGRGDFNIISTTGSPGIIVNGSVTAVPEPSTYGMILAAGLVALILARRRKATVTV